MAEDAKEDVKDEGGIIKGVAPSGTWPALMPGSLGDGMGGGTSYLNKALQCEGLGRCQFLMAQNQFFQQGFPVLQDSLQQGIFSCSATLGMTPDWVWSAFNPFGYLSEVPPWPSPSLLDSVCQQPYCASRGTLVPPVPGAFGLGQPPCSSCCLDCCSLALLSRGSGVRPFVPHRLDSLFQQQPATVPKSQIVLNGDAEAVGAGLPDPQDQDEGESRICLCILSNSCT